MSPVVFGGGEGRVAVSGDLGEDLSGPMEVGRSGGTFVPKSALFAGAGTGLPDGGTNVFAA